MRDNITRIAGRLGLATGLLFVAGCGDSNTHSLGHSVHIDDQKRVVIAAPGRPDAVIDRRHRLFIGERPIALGAAQKADVGRYYQNVRRLDRRGADVGKAGGHFGLRVVKDVFAGLSSGDTNAIDTTVQADKQRFLGKLAPLCHALAQTFAAQRSLVRDLPRFTPYATFDGSDARDCFHKIAEDGQND